MKKLIYFCCFIALVACQQPQKQSDTSFTVGKDFREIEDAYYIYTIGDWGRKGQLGQQALADMMGKAAEVIEPEFIISTGDNFYPNGVASTQDPQWQTSFEEVYSNHSLNCDWYVVLGNHDYRGSAQAEIDYTDVSRRWNMPSRYFHKDITTDEGATVRFLFIDTSPLNDEYYHEEKYSEKVNGQDTIVQLQWIDSLLANAFDWKIVVGHHPLYTGGKRIDDDNYVRNHLEPIFENHQVDVYLAGHEHDLQHLKPTNKVTHHFVSGAGSEVRPTGNLESTLFSTSVQGFLSSAITKDSLFFEFINYKGERIYKYSIK
ncbi:MAG: metallophosphoesterase [Marinoscillum sp.]